MEEDQVMAWEPITPKVAVDIVVVCDRELLVIERKNPPLGFALPGGFVDPGETLFEAAKRECVEETHIYVNEQQVKPIGYLDDPKRDPRMHVISFGFIVYVDEYEKKKARADDDAKSLKWVDLFEDVPFVMQHGIFVKSARIAYERAMNGYA
jgi:ADP-ribose pyrophosphatase YjhB (NUDIX family)